MDEHRPSNGHHPPHEQRIINPYIDALTGAQPPEIVEFERNTAPYAQMPPNMSSRVSVMGISPSRKNWREHPVLTAVSLVVLLLFIAPLILILLDRFLH